MKTTVPFLELGKQYACCRKQIAKAVAALLSRSDFILGEDVRRFEAEFAAYTGARFAVGLNSGTDALFLSLKALDIGPGDEVVVPAFTFIATANAVSYCGARPVFCDIDRASFCIDPRKFRAAISRRTKAVIPVHLFGQCAEMEPLLKIARQNGVAVIEDACQSHGARYTGKAVTGAAGALGDTGCFSFYPTKNLGGWGDGGMAITSREEIYRKLLLLRDCGRKSRYEHSDVGYNSRLDSVQAALLRVKLLRLDSWNKARARCAKQYDSLLAGIRELTLPVTGAASSHVFHIYAVRAENRDRLAEFLKSRNIGVMINYPIPLHLQQAYAGLGHKRGDFPISEKICGDILSLPIHPFLTEAKVAYVCDAIRRFYKQ